MFSYPVTHGYRESFFKIQYKLCKLVFLSDALKSLITVDFRGKGKKNFFRSLSVKGHPDSYSSAFHRAINCVEGQKYFRVSTLGPREVSMLCSVSGGSWALTKGF